MLNCCVKMYRWTFVCMEEAVGSDELNVIGTCWPLAHEENAAC